MPVAHLPDLSFGAGIYRAVQRDSQHSAADFSELQMDLIDTLLASC